MMGAGQLKKLASIGRRIEKMKLPEDVTWEYGGAMEYSRELLPGLILAVIAALCVMFLVLIVHYDKIGISILSISMAVLCLFGATFGLWFFGYDFSITATLGLISLVGIIVRNAIIMYDYVAELRSKEQMSVSEAAY